MYASTDKYIPLAGGGGFGRMDKIENELNAAPGDTEEYIEESSEDMAKGVETIHIQQLCFYIILIKSRDVDPD